MSVAEQCTADLLNELIQDRILFLDGAMGTMIQRMKLTEEMVRGERFHDHDKDLFNFPDLINLTMPDAVVDVHRAYFAAGADIVETNTFGSSPVGLLEFNLPTSLIPELNRSAVQHAKKAAAEFTEKGIRVNGISPGHIKTNIFNNTGLNTEQIEGAIQSIIPTIPFKRLGEPTEIANAVLFLASQEASYIHGTELTVDAGISVIR